MVAVLSDLGLQDSAIPKHYQSNIQAFKDYRSAGDRHRYQDSSEHRWNDVSDFYSQESIVLLQFSAASLSKIFNWTHLWKSNVKKYIGKHWNSFISVVQTIKSSGSDWDSKKDKNKHRFPLDLILHVIAICFTLYFQIPRRMRTVLPVSNFPWLRGVQTRFERVLHPGRARHGPPSLACARGRVSSLAEAHSSWKLYVNR